MKPEMEDGSLKRRETPDPCRPAAETVTSKIPNQLPLAKAGPESFEIRYPAELRTVQARKTFKIALLKDSPETLMADFSLSGETRTKTNLVFFTEQPAAWFNALCNTFRHFKRKGICNGRQLVITEDTDPDITVFTCNIYHNGTVLIQGCEASLDTFEQSFLTVKQQADKEKLRTDCTQQGRQGADCSAADATPSTEPARNTAQLTPSLSPKMLSPVKAIKDCLSDLEREFTEFRESVTAKLNQGESIEQLKDEINKIKNEHKVVVAELKAQASELQLENDRLKSDMKKVREELQKKAPFSETRSLHRELQSLKDTLAQTDIRSTTAPTRSENQVQPQIEKPETALAAVERQKGKSQSQPSEGDILNSAVNTTQQQRRNTTTNTNTDIDNAEHEAPTPSPEEQTQPSNPQTSNKPPQPDVVILIDSNGRYLDERRLFPGKRITKIRCPNTERAFQIIAKPQFVAPKYIIIHTGTNDLPQHSEDLPKSLEQLVELATQRFPAAKIILSTLLLRKDVPEHSIDEINRKISNSCARLPSVHVSRSVSVSWDCARMVGETL
ncbi:UNVERIFIED_CONTAM: hypothetical protein FKN15_017960 [Acipenser sinensis]